MVLIPIFQNTCKIFISEKWDDTEFTMPNLKGSDIERHFFRISQDYTKPYRDLSEQFISKRTNWPKMPPYWREDVSGWIRYNEDGSISSVDAPLEDCFAFDVEVCVLEGHHPVIATALSKLAWYSWISPHLLNITKPRNNCLSTSDLIKGNLHEQVYIKGHILVKLTY